MDIKVVNEVGQEVVEDSTPPQEPSTVLPDGVMLAEQVAQVFDLKPSEISQYKGKLDTLVEYAKLKTDDHSPEGLKWALRSLGTKLGTPAMGEKLINYLHIYAKIYLQGVKIEQEKQRFLKGERDDA